jgi:hypothetical protein
MVRRLRAENQTSEWVKCFLNTTIGFAEIPTDAEEAVARNVVEYSLTKSQIVVLMGALRSRAFWCCYREADEVNKSSFFSGAFFIPVVVISIVLVAFCAFCVCNEEYRLYTLLK